MRRTAVPVPSYASAHPQWGPLLSLSVGSGLALGALVAAVVLCSGFRVTRVRRPERTNA